MSGSPNYYDQHAAVYTFSAQLLDVLGMKRLRQRLLRYAQGKVLEVAAGSGQNLQYYPQGVRITLTDRSGSMLKIAQRQADKLNLSVPAKIMNTEHLNYSNRMFETVVSTLSLCSYDDPLVALREMARVCKLNGRILLLEHGESSWKIVSLLQKWRENWKKKPLCHLTRDPLRLCRQAGLDVISSQRYFFGTIFFVVATNHV